MDSAVLDSDASLDYRSPLRGRRPEHSESVANGGPTRPHTAQATLTRVRGYDTKLARPFGGNGSGGAVALPYPELLPAPPTLERQERTHGLVARAAKRAFDLIGALFLLAVLSPVWLAIAISIKLDSPGPVFFRQRRIGRDGNAFSMLKFRTMIDGADEQKRALLHLNEAAEGLFKINGDPRITKVGAWLRSTCLDELPQLLNVVTGRMSLVGPRPLVPNEDALITGADRRRLTMRPGMTGVWQVGGASLIPINQMVLLDRDYVEDWSLWLDLKLLFRTAHLVALRKGV
jgi:lipopolysaccharide/colanic/teichoic acid biosynthesis glycosyltransferase